MQTLEMEILYKSYIPYFTEVLWLNKSKVIDNDSKQKLFLDSENKQLI